MTLECYALFEARRAGIHKYSTVEQLVPVPLLFVLNQSCGSTNNKIQTLGTVNLVVMHRTTNIYGMTEEAGAYRADRATGTRATDSSTTGLIEYQMKLSLSIAHTAR
jgi:hypothetical protein